MNKFGILKDGEVIFCPNTKVINGKLCTSLSLAEHQKRGEKRVVESSKPRRCPPGYEYRFVGWGENEKIIYRKWKLEKIPKILASVDDYNQALESYIKLVREARGYTDREPTEYLSSSVPRWAQDAKDFVAFRDAVMLYGLGVINEYSATGKAPDMETFKAGFPKITWTYKEEN